MAEHRHDEGGPAFPETEYYDEKPVGSIGGMSLRDYFAAHAPKLQSWFRATMPTTRPVAIPASERPDGSMVNWQELEAWDTEYFRQMYIQWPYAWADTQIAESKRRG